MASSKPIERRTCPGGAAARPGIVQPTGAPGTCRRLTGYAAVYYVSGNAGSEYQAGPKTVERIVPGAFTRALREGHDVRALFNHDENLLLGRSASGTLRLFEDSKGLRYEVDLADTQAGRDVAVHVRRGDVSGSSFSFRAVRDVWRSLPDGRQLRELVDLDLLDVSPVVSPAYLGTEVALRRFPQAPPRGPVVRPWDAYDEMELVEEASKRRLALVRSLEATCRR